MNASFKLLTVAKQRESIEPPNLKASQLLIAAWVNSAKIQASLHISKACTMSSRIGVTWYAYKDRVSKGMQRKLWTKY